ncbi:MAG: flagellin-like protein [Clostridiales bacterium]|nr:flagellin-like protein [Clostridiales bacterium]
MIGMLSTVYAWAMCKWSEFKTEESGAVDIVAIVVMIGIAVVLAVVFRESVAHLLESLFESITNSATDAIKPS